MATLVFTNTTSGNTSLYITANDNGWCAYLLAMGVTGPQGGQLSLLDLPKYNGYLLFSVNQPSIDITTFVTNVYTFLGPLQTYQSGSIVWFNSPNTTLTQHNTPQLILSGQSVLQSLNFNIGNSFATLFISNNNTSLTVDTVNNVIQLTGQQGATNFTFRPNNLASSSLVMSGLEIPLIGPGRGRIRFTFGFNHASDFIGFGVNNKYFYNNAQNGQLTELSYQLITPGSLNEFIMAQASIYPSDLLNITGTNTYFALLGQTFNNNTQQYSTTVLSSYYLTNFGYTVSLVPYTNFVVNGVSLNYPTQNSAMLVFSERAPNDPSDLWYLLLNGAFALTVDSMYQPNVDSNKQMQLMCGLASTEGISFTPQFFNSGTNAITGNGDWLYYLANQNAFAPQFPVTATQNFVGSNTVQQWPTNAFVTAWSGVVLSNTTNKPVVYHAQPQGAALFSQSQDASSPLFNHLSTGSGVLSQAKKTIFFPMVPYGGVTVTPTGADISLFENQILNPTRKATIAAVMTAENIPASPPVNTKLKGAAANGIPSTSPQGFYINVDTQDGKWDVLQLASNQFIRSDGTQSKVFNLQFTPASSVLQSALQSHQLFLVISYNKEYDPVTHARVLDNFANEMEIVEWPFNLNVPTVSANGKYKNVIIFKFCSGALIDKVQNIQGWNMPGMFNSTDDNGLPNLSMWLQEYIQNGMDKHTIQGDKDYLKFYNIATQKDWQGIIALGVDISVQDFPKELQGLIAGIDLSRFYAHHFGVDISIVNNNNGSVGMQPTSSLFGLIDYEDQTFEALGASPVAYQQQAPINTSIDYDFKVLKLKVVFVNSKIYNYNSYLAFTVNKLFGEQVDATNRNNLLIFTGTYENHNGVPSYTFTNTADNVLNLVNRSIITDVEIVKAAFVTIVQQDGTGDGIVRSQFGFWGFINFNNLSGFDLFSFGAESGVVVPSYCGLSYSNLYIDLSFPLATPTTKTYTFDISHTAFDIGQSTPRKDSLYAHFPLQLSGIISGDSTNTPTIQGYLDVSISSLEQQQGISGPWYGLVFNLNMGTLGSLASTAGFTSTFMMAWSVGATGAWAGVKLPGVNPQAPSFSLQGILKLNIGLISLEKATPTTSSTAYLMKINNIALKLFSLSFPPGGDISFMLFGNPGTDAQPESLGWYGAYVKS
jgi:hypothetical protein